MYTSKGLFFPFLSMEYKLLETIYLDFIMYGKKKLQRINRFIQSRLM